MKTWNLIIIPVLLILGGCSEIAAERRFERSLPSESPVTANGISARTPLDHLLIKKVKNGFTLQDADGFLSFSAFNNNLLFIQHLITEDRAKATGFKTLKAYARGKSLDIYMAAFQKNGGVKVVYYTYFGASEAGISAEYVRFYFADTFDGRPGWDKIPPEFVRFVDSIEHETKK